MMHGELIKIDKFDKPPPVEPGRTLCCEARTASCLACMAGISVTEYCNGNPNMDGCDTVNVNKKLQDFQPPLIKKGDFPSKGGPIEQPPPGNGMIPVEKQMQLEMIHAKIMKSQDKP